MRTLFFDATHRLIDALERLRTTLAHDASAGSGATHLGQLFDSVNRLTSHYEVVVWEVLMPHLIRSAPTLASDTVTTLQANHQNEKQLRDVFKRRAADAALVDPERRSELVASAGRLAEVLRDSLRLFESEVWVAFEALPDEERSALIAVVEHERARLDGKDEGLPASVSRAIDVLESDRASLPT